MRGGWVWEARPSALPCTEHGGRVSMAGPGVMVWRQAGGTWELSGCLFPSEWPVPGLGVSQQAQDPTLQGHSKPTSSVCCRPQRLALRPSKRR